MFADDSSESGGTKLESSALEAFEMGQRYVESHEYAMAVKAFQFALTLRPDDPSIFASLGWVMFKGRMEVVEDEAAQTIQRALNLQPDLDLGHYYLGCISKAKGELDEARRCFETCIGHNPRNRAAVRELRRLEKQLK